MSWLSKLKVNSDFDINQEYEFKRFVPESKEGQDKLFEQAQEKIQSALSSGESVAGLTLEEGITLSFYLEATPTLTLKFAFPDTGGIRPVYVNALLSISAPGGLLIAFPYSEEDAKTTNMVIVDSPEVKPLSEHTQDLFQMHAPFDESHLGDRKVGTAKERAFLIMDTLVALKMYNIPHQTMINGGYIEEFMKWVEESVGPYKLDSQKAS